MTYDWYNVINYQDFVDADIPSRVLKRYLTGIGQKDIMIVRGSMVGVVYEGVLLPVQFQGKNPFEFDGYAVYINEEDDILLGIAVEE